MIFLYDMDLQNITRNQWLGTAVSKKNNEEAKSSIFKENREEKETEKLLGSVYSSSPWWQQYNPKSVICYVAWIESL